MSARNTVTAAGKAFGVTPSSVSRHLVEATAKQLKQFQGSRRVSALRDVPRHGPPRRSGVRGSVKGKSSPWASGKGRRRRCEELLEELERRGLKTDPRNRWWRGDHQGAQRPIRAHPPAVYFAQRPQHPAPPAQTLPPGTPPLRDCLGAEQLQGREEDVAERWLRDINESAAARGT